MPAIAHACSGITCRLRLAVLPPAGPSTQLLTWRRWRAGSACWPRWLLCGVSIDWFRAVLVFSTFRGGSLDTARSSLSKQCCLGPWVRPRLLTPVSSSRRPQELAARMAADEAAFRRRPKNLVVHYRRAIFFFVLASQAQGGLADELASPVSGTRCSSSKRLAAPCPLPSGLHAPPCWRRGGAHASSERSKSCSMPRFSSGAPSAAVIADAAIALFKAK